MPSTTAMLLRSLDVIVFEITRMENVLRDSKHVTGADRHELRRRIAIMGAEADALMNWLSESRLEEDKN